MIIEQMITEFKNDLSIIDGGIETINRSILSLIEERERLVECKSDRLYAIKVLQKEEKEKAKIKREVKLSRLQKNYNNIMKTVKRLDLQIDTPYSCELTQGWNDKDLYEEVCHQITVIKNLPIDNKEKARLKNHCYRFIKQYQPLVKGKATVSHGELYKLK